MVIASKNTDQQQLASQVLELHSHGKVNFISRRGSNMSYQLIVDQVRHHIPDKETSANPAKS